MAQFYPTFLDGIKNIPGIRTAALAETAPLGTSMSATGIQVKGSTASGSERQLMVGRNRVSPEFFRTMSIPILQGRAFDERDCKGEERVAIINQTLAQRLWPGSNPIGKRYRGSDTDPWTEVVGLVRNARSSKLWEPDQPYVYVPYRALEQTNRPNMEVLVRTEGDPRLAMGTIRANVRALDPSLRPRLTVLEQNLERWIAPSRVGAFLSTALGLLALTLAAIGLFGMMAFSVSQRTREIGVRMALGAQRAEVLHLVLRQGLPLVIVGVGLGLFGGGVLARALAKFLFGLSPLDAQNHKSQI
jgi:putative ABC transport system permease protein